MGNNQGRKPERLSQSGRKHSQLMNAIGSVAGETSASRREIMQEISGRVSRSTDEMTIKHYNLADKIEDNARKFRQVASVILIVNIGTFIAVVSSLLTK
jgi:hypothetical protein